jgi:glucosyl-dolichyl phosphate glucuronosyltransferase
LAKSKVSLRLTIAIPTHNRASLLRETLASVSALALDTDLEAECVVIDNNSADDTPSVVEEFSARMPFSIRRVMESRVGSSFARNRAVDEAHGDFIFFIDDDVRVERTWAREMLDSMRARNLDVGCGAVVPKWLAPPPRWLGPRLYSKLAVHSTQSLDSSDSLERLHNYFSANAGFRRETFERFGRFREDLGVVGGNPMSGEDTELFARIIERGGKVGFVAQARVHHQIGPERLTREYLRRKSFAYGMGSAFAGGRSHNRLDKLAKNVARMLSAGARGDAEGVVYHQLEIANFAGYWWARLKMRARPITS